MAVAWIKTVACSTSKNIFLQKDKTKQNKSQTISSISCLPEVPGYRIFCWERRVHDGSGSVYVSSNLLVSFGISAECAPWYPCSRFPVPLSPVTSGAAALEVYTPKEIFVANGTQGKLTCKFKSTNTTGTLTTVSWSFQPEGADTTVSFFHYSQGQVYPGNYPPFKDRISWAGDLDKKDASINIENMQFIHNGTYICDVKNPPDIVAQPGHIRLYVVEKEIVPVFPVWVVVGIVTAVVVGVILLISTVLAVLYRRRNSKRDYTGCSTSESVSPVKQAPRKSPSDTEGLVKSLPSASHQGPVIYAQLDHSGGHHSDKINKSESVVYADIRKN
ncbi:PREDICTED: myelin protein zero-like protein 1 [Hipposideros armiger]|uniref:Myelin protein zero-like protein 1 n=1 Tax=Hipposideros armiger TaxID=186990 RepID=A0A8B7RN02_HIPAR|nr:PREDICTED: myelin protein zero-like protein 1 [Hipposideros armiger]